LAPCDDWRDTDSWTAARVTAPKSTTTKLPGTSSVGRLTALSVDPANWGVARGWRWDGGAAHQAAGLGGDGGGGGGPEGNVALVGGGGGARGVHEGMDGKGDRDRAGAQR